MYTPPPLHSHRYPGARVRARRQQAEETTTFHLILGFFVLGAMGVLGIAVVFGALVISALTIYGLWDFGHFLLGG